MSEPALRQLDRDLPRVDMYSPAFRRRVTEARKREAEAVAKVIRDAEAYLRRVDRDNRREEAKAAALAMEAQNELTISEARKFAIQQKHEAQLVAEGIPPDEPLVPANDIINDVVTKYGIPVAVIRGPSRSKAVVAVRHEAISRVHLARPDLSLPALGRIFNRNHTSVLWALRKMGVWNATVGAAE